MTGTTKDFKCAVRADLFARAMVAICKEDTRYYLGGVCVMEAPEGGALMVATDGHILVAVRDPRGLVTGSGLVTLDPGMTKALKHHRDDSRRSRFGCNSERVLVMDNTRDEQQGQAMIVINGPRTESEDGTISDPRSEAFENLTNPGMAVVQTQFFDLLIDGTFPDFQRAIPDKVDFSARPPVLDQRLIDRVSKALASPTHRQPQHVILGPSKNDPRYSPVMVIPGTLEPLDFDIMAVVMPMMWTDTPPQVKPFWKKQEA